MAMTSSLRVADDLTFATYQQIHAPFNRPASSFSRCWSGVAGGNFAPDWWTSDLRIPGNGFGLYEARDIWYMPRHGVIISKDMSISTHSAYQAGYTDPTFSFVNEALNKCDNCKIIEAASIALPWGAYRNYGHFILDGLTSVSYLEAAPIFTPPLTEWQSQHFALTGSNPIQLEDDIYKVNVAYYTTGFGQNLHNPNLHFMRLRQYQLGRVERPDLLIYLSRDGQKRQFQSEPDLIERLLEIGFTVIKPESMRIADQIEIFQRAKIIVAPTGAALANCLYCQPSTRVIELIPRDMTRNPNTHKWVAYLAALTGGDWRPYFCENSVGLEQMPTIGGTQRPGFLPFDAHVPDLMRFIEKAMVDPL